MTAQEEDGLDREASNLSRGDMALWFHHRALLVGEWTIYHRGNAHWRSYLRTKKLPQYSAAEQSVIEGWRKYIQNTAGIPPERQRDRYAVNCGLVFDWLRRKAGKAQLANVFKRRADTFYTAAKKGDLDFFRHVGRLLGDKGNSNYLQRFEYAHGMLWRWLTECYWLMPAKIASQLVAIGLSVPDKEKTFLAIKSRYGLRSHNPPLIERLERKGKFLQPVLTKQGRILLG